jgi:hypothetical protein
MTGTGGKVNDYNTQTFTTEGAVTYPGTLIKKGSAAGKVDICGAGEVPIGFAFGSSKNPITKVAEANVKLSVTALIDGWSVEIPLLATNQAISAWDEVETTAGGTVDLKSGAGEVIGYALEAKAANAGATTSNFILVRIQRRTALA